MVASTTKKETKVKDNCMEDKNCKVVAKNVYGPKQDNGDNKSIKKLKRPIVKISKTAIRY